MVLEIPEDVAVAGIGDIPFAALVSPPLTTATVPSLEIGKLAADLIQGGKRQNMTVSMEMILRKSL